MQSYTPTPPGDKSRAESSIRFVARHYEPGAFDERRTLRAITGRLFLWNRRRIAAAASAAVIFTAAAGLIAYVNTPRGAAPELPAAEETVVPAPAPAAPVTARVEFVDTPLGDVVAEIERIYGVKVGGLARQKSERLTLSYEGTAEGLIENINLLMDTHLTIEK